MLLHMQPKPRLPKQVAKSVAILQQFVTRSCYKLIAKTCYPQACCKLFQQVVTSLEMTSCNKPDFNRLATI